jgi:hypothetical protein
MPLHRDMNLTRCARLATRFGGRPRHDRRHVDELLAAFILALCPCSVPVPSSFEQLERSSAEAGVLEDGCEAGDEGSASQGDDYPLTTRGGTQRAVALSATRTHERTFVGLQQYYTWTWTASGIENAPHHNQTEGAVRLSKQGHRSTAERLSGP